MKHRILGGTGLRASVIGIGTWQFGGEWAKRFTQEDATSILARGRELGINLLDTAECYGDHLSESFIGGAIASGSAGRREDWIIATKFGHAFHGHLNRTEGGVAQSPANRLRRRLPIPFDA
jgi:aryl-alcohol dehydrogenase-like predicted oxidoreductase